MSCYDSTSSSDSAFMATLKIFGIYALQAVGQEAFMDIGAGMVTKLVTKKPVALPMPTPFSAAENVLQMGRKVS